MKSFISHVLKGEHRCCIIWSDILRKESELSGKTPQCCEKILEASGERGESGFANCFFTMHLTSSLNYGNELS